MDDYVDISYDASFYPTSLTISGWINVNGLPSGSQLGTIFSNAGSGTNPPYDPLQVYMDSDGYLKVSFEGAKKVLYDARQIEMLDENSKNYISGDFTHEMIKSGVKYAAAVFPEDIFA